MVFIGGLGPGDLGFESGNPFHNNPFHRGIQSESKAAGSKPPIKNHLLNWLVVSTHLKNMSQIGHLPQIGVKIKKYLKPPPSESSSLST